MTSGRDNPGFQPAFEDQFPSNHLELSENLRQTLDHYSIVAITNVKGTIVYANDNFCKISKYEREELLGQDHRIINSGHHPKSFFKKLWSTILKGEIWHGEIKNLAKDDSFYWTDTHIVPQRDENGEIRYFVAIRVDITARKNAERENEIQRQQLLVADKMASLGILTTGVAHEINNPNHLIMSNTELLGSIWEDIQGILNDYESEHGSFEISSIPYPELKQQIPQIFKRIQGGTVRIKNIVDNLKKFAREEDPFTGQPLYLNMAVQGAYVLVESLLKKSTHRFSMELDDEIPMIKGHLQQLEQVIINLLTNACQALPTADRAIELLTSFNKSEGTVELIVKDEGKGIDSADMKKIFDPFYTTKRDCGGTGLGLFVSYGIIKKHNAKIEFTSKKDKGTIATLSFPAILNEDLS